MDDTRDYEEVLDDETERYIKAFVQLGEGGRGCWSYFI